MRPKLSILVILLLVIFACNYDKNEVYKKESNKDDKNEETSKVTLYKYQIWTSDLDKVDLRDSLVGFATISKRIDRTIILLQFLPKNHSSIMLFNLKPKNDYYSSFGYVIVDDIINNGIDCNLIDTIFIDYNNEHIEVFVSSWSMENAADVGTNIYWNNEIGVIAEYNYSWGILVLFDYEKFKDFTKVNFYNHIIKMEEDLKPEELLPVPDNK